MPLLSMTLAAFAAAAIQQGPPRQESPVPQDVAADIGTGNSDAEFEQAIAAAAAHPLGTAANPIRVGGPEGAQNYFANLRCADGSLPKVGAAREGGVGTYGSVLRLYPLDCGSAAPGKVDLRVDLYQEEHPETRPPAGFRLQR